MDKVVLLPALAVLLMVGGYGLEGVFLNVYLPSLLLLPQFRSQLPLQPCFSQGAIVPIAIIFLWRARFRWRFSTMDLFVFAFAAWGVLSVNVSDGYKVAQNFGFSTFTFIIIPYLLGKELIARRGLEARFARRFVILIFVDCVVSVYEFRMRTNLFNTVIQPLFPYRYDITGSAFGSTQARWGFGRVAGPLTHSILFGIFIVSAILLNMWLMRSGIWERDWGGLRLPCAKSKIIMAGLLVGSLMTMSRGPWISGAFGLALGMVGIARNPKKTFAVACVSVVVLSTAVWAITQHYSSVNASSPQVAEEEASAAYRLVLTTEYQDIALQRPLWGWGTSWPTVPGMASIDNAFLYLALESGVTQVVLFVLVLGVMLVRMVRAGLLRVDPQGRAVLFVLAGLWISFIVSLGTTYMGPEFTSLAFLIAGWAEGLIIAPPGEVTVTAPRRRVAPYRFERVYA